MNEAPSDPGQAAGRRLTPRERLRPLAGQDLERYVQTVSRLVLAARLNKWYPDPFACSDRLRMLAPSVRGAAYDGATLDLASGLPYLKDVVAVQADRDLAAAFVAEQESRLAAGKTLTPRVQAKLEYYRRLLKVSLPPLTSLDVRLRRVFPERGVAAFQVVFDRYDAAGQVFSRYTLLLEQTDGVWGGSLLERSGDYTRQTGDFRQLMERCAQDESEILFLLLGKREGVRVEEVTRGRIGPVWSPWAPPPPGWFPPDPREAFILHCPLDSASVAYEADSDTDPFSSFFKDFLSDISRPMIEEAADTLGYKVHKERKFACTPQALGPLQERLREARTRNVIYTL